jgi:hypothetical protein
VTPEPGARSLVNVDEEEEKAMFSVVSVAAGAFRHCEPPGRRNAPPDDKRHEAIHWATKEDGLLRRCAPRNDGKKLICSLAPFAPICLTMRRICGRGLSLGTVKERIAPESVTRMLSGFVHRNISRGRLGYGTRSSLARLHKRPNGSEILKRCGGGESNQN